MLVKRGVFLNRTMAVAGLFLAVGGAVAEVRFKPVVAYPVTSADYGTAVDVDKDGKLDIVGANRAEGAFILYGVGDGTFEAAVYHPIVASVYEVTPADVNSDGRLDLIACCIRNASVAVVLATGPRTYAAPVLYAVGNDPYGVAAGDLNEDGWLDLAVSNDWSDTVSILINKGDGTFKPKTDLPAGSHPSDVIIVDLNLDGHLDVASSAYSSHDTRVWFGNGAGGLTYSNRYVSADGAFGVMTADFDNNGTPDLAVTNYWSFTSSILLNDGNGQFTVKPQVAAGPYPHTSRAADINMDGRMDLVIPNSTEGKFNVQLNTGGGVISEPIFFDTGGSWSRTVATGDFDGDGRIDVAVSDTDEGMVYVRLNETGVTSVSGLSIMPSSVYGGNSTTGTVTIGAPAAVGGQAVKLSSDNAAASVPASVTVPGGKTSATFTITTAGVAVKATAVVKAEIGGSFKTASVYVHPSIPSSILYNPTQVRGGKPVTATLTLSGKAPPGGLAVNVASLHPSVLAPDTAWIAVPEGQSSTTFEVTTYPVTSLVTGALKAAAHGASIQIGLKVYPAAPTLIRFGHHSVYGGNPMAATLVLSSPAPAGGMTVALKSDNPALASVPTAVTVPAGETAVGFLVQTYGVSFQRMVVVSATANGETIYFGLRLYPAVPLHIRYDPNPVKGGNAVTATLFLNGTAPPGGLTVSLQAMNPAIATGPSSVWIAEGLTGTTFPVTTSAVTANKLAVFKATTNRSSIYIGLRVAP